MAAEPAAANEDQEQREQQAVNEVLAEASEAGRRAAEWVRELAPRPPGAKGAVVKKAGGKPSAFDRGLAALARYRGRTESVTVPRAHVEELTDGEGGTVVQAAGQGVLHAVGALAPDQRQATIVEERRAHPYPGRRGHRPVAGSSASSGRTGSGQDGSGAQVGQPAANGPLSTAPTTRCDGPPRTASGHYGRTAEPITEHKPLKDRG
ncbi:hypothetical protein ACFU6K_12020 [Kitasatospora sp. NPDC057512]|uniref:hypothetical protein n=1 Tax=Kitasatospora sp. NPDC057512 TaxID=3346154 RepID=UPI00367CC1DA